MATSTIGQAKWEMSSSISLPYVAPRDGFIFANLRPETSALSGYYITKNTESFINIVSRDGVNSQMFAPVKKGDVLANSYSTNVRSVTIHFYSI